MFPSDAKLRPIAVFIPELHESGGTERATYQCIRRWAARRDVHVFARDASVELPDNVQVHTIRLVRRPQLIGWLLFAGWCTWKAQLLRRRHRDFIIFSPGVNCVGADVTVAHIYYRQTNRVLRRDRDSRRVMLRPSLRSIHSWVYSRVVRMLEAVHYKHSGYVFAVSDLERNQMQADGLKVAGLAPNGVVASEFRTLRETAGSPVRVLTIGSEIHKKGLDIAVVAAAGPRLRGRIELTIVTRAQNAVQLSELAADLGLTGLEILSEPVRTAEVMQRCDVYLGASREDSFNMPALEAMAAGMPVVISNRCGLSTWATGAALVVEPDEDAIAGAIETLLDSDIEWTSLALAGEELAGRFTWDVTADVIEEAFRALDRCRPV